jgi:hypothetical protein
MEIILSKKRSGNILFAALFVIFALQSSTAFGVESGRWDGTADFGTFEFGVSSDGAAIESINYHFSDWSCNSVDLTGDYSIIAESPWKIRGGSFGFTVELEPGAVIRLFGTFLSSKLVSGSFQVTAQGAICEGFWEADYAASNRSIDHAFVEGVYWNPEDLPGWGFFTDIQENLFFGAVYGYLDGESTFITLQGSLASSFPMSYQGDAFFITDDGTTSTDVGDFNWMVGDTHASPSALLTLSSNILNVTDLDLVRFSYAESDEVDVMTGGNWNIIRRTSASTFGDHYRITDERTVDDEVTYAKVMDLGSPGKEGQVGFFPDIDGDFFGMLIDFGETTEAYYLFLSTNTDMYGRFWILGTGDRPTGNGEHFRGAADTLQVADLNGSASSSAMQMGSKPESSPQAVIRADIKALEILQHQNPGGQLEPMFEDAKVQLVFKKLSHMKRTLSEQAR